jgi:predicted alpha/beta-fold hydrolase
VGIKELPFDPCPFFSHPHQQTCFSTLKYWISHPSSERGVISLSDGDKIVIESNTPKNWKNTDPTVLCLHGLCGSHLSSYLIRLVNRLDPLGIKTVRLNMRGCGSGKGLAKQIYHSGRSDDVLEVVQFLKREFPESPLIVIGFSLGGNIVLKMAGELSSSAQKLIDQVIAVSPPVDLLSSTILIRNAANGLYEKYFYRRLRKDVLELHDLFKDLPPVHLPKNLSLYEFDRVYTVPRIGFSSIEEYYQKASSMYLVDQIEVPCKILFSEDDPIVSHKSLDEHDLPSNVEVYKTKKGGHMGYLGNPSSSRGFYWLDSILEDWILTENSG